MHEMCSVCVCEDVCLKAHVIQRITCYWMLAVSRTTVHLKQSLHLVPYQSATALLTSGKDEEEEEGSSCMQLMLLLLMWLKVLQCCFGCGMQSVGNTYQTIEQHKSVPKHVTKEGRMLSKGLTLFCWKSVKIRESNERTRTKRFIMRNSTFKFTLLWTHLSSSLYL